MISVLLFLLTVHPTTSEKLEFVDCGVDESPTVFEGDVKITQYPWLGILYYTYRDIDADVKSITQVALIHREFVIAAAADIGPMPKHDFRRKSRVLLGENWQSPGRRVRNYVIHPEYGETYNTIALIHLRDVARINHMYPLCPPPNTILKNPAFYVIKMKENYKVLEKEVLRVMHVPGAMCKDFYVAANLYEKMLRPPHVACAVSLETNEVCVWDAGAALVVRDVWGRWQLLGISVRGPGCGAPSRYLDMMSYLPWIEESLDKFQRVTITKINDHRYVLRSGNDKVVQRFGDCDTEEIQEIMYREQMLLVTNNNQRQNVVYNMTILDHVEFTCLTLALINATASSAIIVKHFCGRENFGAPCYHYKYSSFDIAMEMSFSDSCWFQMTAYGWHRNMTLIDIQNWKWQEGAYYEDFSLTRVEYQGPTYMTDFGFEPIDLGMWIPEYDLWTTTGHIVGMSSEEQYEMVVVTFSDTTHSPITRSTTTTPKKKTPRKKTSATTPPKAKPKESGSIFSLFG